MNKKFLSFTIYFLGMIQCIYAGAAARTVMVDNNGKLTYPSTTEFTNSNNIVRVDENGVLQNPDAATFITANNIGTVATTPYIFIDMSTSLVQGDGSSALIYTPFDVEFKITDYTTSSGERLIYWVSTCDGKYVGSGYSSHPAADTTAQIYFLYRTSNSNNRPVWIRKSATYDSIYEQIQQTLNIDYENGGIGGILIIPSISAEKIKNIFNDLKRDPTRYAAIYLRCSGDDAEKRNNIKLWQNANIQFR